MEAIPPLPFGMPSGLPGVSSGLTPEDLAARVAAAKQIVTDAQAEALETLLSGRRTGSGFLAPEPTGGFLAPRPATPVLQTQQLMQVIADADLTLQEMVVVVRVLAGRNPAVPVVLPKGLVPMLPNQAGAPQAGPSGPPVGTSPLTPVRLAPATPPWPSTVTLAQGGYVAHVDLAADLVEAIHVLRVALGPSLAPLLPDLEAFQAPVGEALPGQAPTGQAPTGQAPTGQAPGQVPSAPAPPPTTPHPAPQASAQPQPANQHAAVPPEAQADSHAVPTQATVASDHTKLAAALQTGSLRDIDLTRLGQTTLQVGKHTVELDLTGAALTPQDFAGVSAQINSALQGQGMAVDLWAAYAGIWRQYGGWIALAMPSLLAWRLSLAVPPSRPRRFRRREEEKRKGSGRRRR